MTAELAQLSGWMSYDQGLHGLAQRYYMLALHACRESANAELGAKVIGDMTQLSTARGHYDDSLSYVQTALSSLPRGSNRMVRSELLGLEARACAHLGDGEASNAARAADRCVEVFHESTSEVRPDWLHYMNQAEVDCLAANTYIELALYDTDATRANRHAARAEYYTVDACEQRGESYTRSRILDEIRLGKVRLAQREPDEAASVGLRSLSFAQDVRSSVVVDWLRRFDSELHVRYPTLTSVQEFRDQLTAHVRNIAPQKTG